MGIMCTSLVATAPLRASRKSYSTHVCYAIKLVGAHVVVLPPLHGLMCISIYNNI